MNPFRVGDCHQEIFRLNKALDDQTKAFNSINERQRVLIEELMAKAEEQRQAAEAGWKRVAELQAAATFKKTLEV